MYVLCRNDELNGFKHKAILVFEGKCCYCNDTVVTLSDCSMKLIAAVMVATLKSPLF